MILALGFGLTLGFGLALGFGLVSPEKDELNLDAIDRVPSATLRATVAAGRGGVVVGGAALGEVNPLEPGAYAGPLGAAEPEVGADDAGPADSAAGVAFLLGAADPRTTGTPIRPLPY